MIFNRQGLVTNWREAWRWSSVRFGAAVAAFGSLPADKQAAILSWLHLTPVDLLAISGWVFILTRVSSLRKVEESSQEAQNDEGKG